MKKLAALTLAALALCFGFSGGGMTNASAAEPEVKQERLQAERAEIDTIARQSMDRLLAEEPKARAVRDKAHGYAVFDSTKVAFGISGGGGIARLFMSHPPLDERIAALRTAGVPGTMR